MHLYGCCVQQDPVSWRAAERWIMEHESSDASSGIERAPDSAALPQAKNRWVPKDAGLLPFWLFLLLRRDRVSPKIIVSPQAAVTPPRPMVWNQIEMVLCLVTITGASSAASSPSRGKSWGGMAGSLLHLNSLLFLPFLSLQLLRLFVTTSSTLSVQREGISSPSHAGLAAGGQHLSSIRYRPTWNPTIQICRTVARSKALPWLWYFYLHDGLV